MSTSPADDGVQELPLLSRILVCGLLFAVFGPLVATIILFPVALILAGMSRAGLSAESLSIILMMLPVLSYYLGALPALLAGMITGCLTRHLQSYRVQLAIASMAALISVVYVRHMVVGDLYWMAAALSGFITTLVCIYPSRYLYTATTAQ